MVQLSLMEEIKDKASRLIPTAYMEIVEECTAPHLLIPTYEHVKFLCETVNRKPEAIVDVVRALRRRIADPDVAAKHLTIQLIESMIKSSTTSFHVELASQKGLLRDLVAVACLQPTTGRAMQAKEAALLLTLNLSIWFRAHPAEECYILTTLADDVRNQMGPNCFEGLEPERSARMRVQVDPTSRLRVPPTSQNQQRQRSRDDHTSRSRTQQHERRNVVDAIPIDYPTSERISAMLDACMTFSEYVNNAEMNPEVSLRDDEVVQSYLLQVRDDHNYVTILLSSNLQLDRDVLRTVSDSQSAVIAKVEKAVAAPASRSTGQPRPQTPPAALQSTPVRSAEDTEQPPHSQHIDPLLAAAAPRATPPRAEVPGGLAAWEQPTGSSISTAAAAAPPSVDDLFADVNAAAAAPAATPAVTAAAPSTSTTPERSTTRALADAAPPAATEPVAAPPSAAPAQAREEAEAEAETEAETAAPAEAAAEAAAEAPNEEEAEKQQEQEQEQTADAEPVDTPADPAAPDAAAAAPASESTPAPPAAAPAAAPPKDDDDFDAFLEGHMGS